MSASLNTDVCVCVLWTSLTTRIKQSFAKQHQTQQKTPDRYFPLWGQTLQLFSMSSIETLLSEIEEIASTADLSIRHRLSEKLRCLSCSIATPRQAMQYHGHMYTEHVVARIAADLDLFTILTENDGPLNTEEIAKKNAAVIPHL